MIYLDHDASAPLWPSVLTCMHDAARVGGNPSSLHGLGRLARRRIDTASDQVRALLQAGSAEMVFVSGAQEANALGLIGLARVRRQASGQRVVVVDKTPSPDLAVCLEPLRQEGFEVRSIDMAHAAAHLDADVAVVALASAHADTGVLQPVAAVVAHAMAMGVPVHVDATRAAATVPVDFAAQGMTTLAVCGQRLGGPAACGVLVVKKGQTLAPLWGGGGQQQGWRSGSQPVALIAGLGEAAQQTRQAQEAAPPWQPLRDALETGLTQHPEEFAVLGAAAQRLPHVSCVAVHKRQASAWVSALSERGVMVGAPAPDRLCFSLGWTTRAADITKTVHAIKLCLERDAA